VPRNWRPYAWLLGLLWALPLLVTVVGYAILPKHVTAERCEGIGRFGCDLPPADTLLLSALVASNVLIPAGLLGIAVLAVVQARRREPRRGG
jgi:hypothetical protein